MSATTFPRFLELPKELQIWIWEQAVLSLDFSTIPAEVNPNSVNVTKKSWVDITYAVLFEEREASTPVKIRAQHFLDVMHASRLSQRVVLETWGKMLDVADAAPEEPEERFSFHGIICRCALLQVWYLLGGERGEDAAREMLRGLEALRE